MPPRQGGPGRHDPTVRRDASRSRRPLLRFGGAAAFVLWLGLAPASRLRELPLAPDPGWPRVDIEGPAVEAPGVERALAHVFLTKVGTQARARLVSGALPEPLTIVLNTHRDNLTLYRVAGRELSQTILFDPAAFPLVETDAGHALGDGRDRAGPRARPRRLRHEAPRKQVIREVENPVRAELGLPLRTRSSGLGGLRSPHDVDRHGGPVDGSAPSFGDITVSFDVADVVNAYLGSKLGFQVRLKDDLATTDFAQRGRHGACRTMPGPRSSCSRPSPARRAARARPGDSRVPPPPRLTPRAAVGACAREGTLRGGNSVSQRLWFARCVVAALGLFGAGSSAAVTLLPSAYRTMHVYPELGVPRPSIRPPQPSATEDDGPRTVRSSAHSSNSTIGTQPVASAQLGDRLPAVLRGTRSSCTPSTRHPTSRSSPPTTSTAA